MFAIGLVLLAVALKPEKRRAINFFSQKIEQVIQSNSTKHGKDARDEEIIQSCFNLMIVNVPCPNSTSCTALSEGDWKRAGEGVGLCCSFLDFQNTTANCKRLVDMCQKYYKDEKDGLTASELAIISAACDKYCLEQYQYPFASWCPYQGGYAFVAIIILAVLLVALIVLILVCWLIKRREGVQHFS
jgi:hypothetical protein